MTQWHLGKHHGPDNCYRYLDMDSWPECASVVVKIQDITGRFSPDAQGEANARLIAAAHDLLESLINLRSFAQDYSGPKIDRIKAKADAAIAKAKGESK